MYSSISNIDTELQLYQDYFLTYYGGATVFSPLGHGGDPLYQGVETS